MGNFEDVGRFHQRFKLKNNLDDGAGPRDYTPHELSELLNFRASFLQEELDEFVKAANEGDHPEMFDALLDLTYVAMGTAHLLGYPWHEGWREVQRSNMLKERATSEDMSKRRSELDVIKPPGWLPPQIDEILEEFGF